MLVYRLFQVSHQMIDRVEVRPPAGRLQDTLCFSEPLLKLSRLCVQSHCVNREGEPPALSEVLSALYQVFKYFAPFRLPSTPTSLSVPAAETGQHSGPDLESWF